MPITNNSRVLNYLPYAIGAYGTGAGTPGLQVGTAVPVNVPKFEATPNSGFQGALYKDGATGKYVIAFAGTNDLTDAVSADRRLASANLLEHYGTGSWDPQMTDALKFGYEAFRQIQTDHYAATGKEISLNPLSNV